MLDKSNMYTVSKSKLITILATFLLGGVAGLMLLPQMNVVSAGIGISPATVENKFLKPGSSFRQEVIISQSDPSEEVVISVETDLGAANEWVTFEPASTFTISRGVQRYPMTMIVNVPDGVDLQEYNGVIRVKATTLSPDAVPGGVSVVKGARVEVTFITTNLDFNDLKVRAVEITDAKAMGPITMEMSIENKGNVPATADTVSLKILNLNQEELELLEDSDLSSVEPGETQIVTANFTTGLPAGEYFAEVAITFRDEILRSDMLAFEIEENTEPTSVTTADQATLLGLPRDVMVGATVGIIVIAVIGVLVLVTRSKSSKEQTTPVEGDMT